MCQTRDKNERTVTTETTTFFFHSSSMCQQSKSLAQTLEKVPKIKISYPNPLQSTKNLRNHPTWGHQCIPVHTSPATCFSISVKVHCQPSHLLQSDPQRPSSLAMSDACVLGPMRTQNFTLSCPIHPKLENIGHQLQQASHCPSTSHNSLPMQGHWHLRQHPLANPTPNAARTCSPVQHLASLCR